MSHQNKPTSGNDQPLNNSESSTKTTSTNKITSTKNNDENSLFTTDKPIHNIFKQPIKNSSVTTPKAQSAMNRRRFMRNVGVGVAGGASLGLVGCGSDSDNNLLSGKPNQPSDNVSFEHGVASGDPLSDRVILWTRVTPKPNAGVKEVKVSWVIASNDKLTNPISSGTVTTNASNDYTVKVDVADLEPNQTYYYQFSVDTLKSRVGKTKTLPVGRVDSIKLAVFSCANYPAGYFHVYADAASRNDLDACVHLGDYIYEYGRTTTAPDGSIIPAYASAHAADIDREVVPPTEITKIDDYRQRYAQYRTDPDLQDLHASIPMIAVWDDHELSNDAYMTGAGNHQPNEGSWDERKLSAVVAYHEWMPIRSPAPNKIYRRFDFGDLLSLHMLDTRVVGREKPLDYANFIKPDTNGNLSVDAPAFNEAINNPSRQLLGLAQHNWLVNQLQTSNATWQVLGQQVLMAKIALPAPLILHVANPNLGVDFATYMGLVNKAQTAPQTLTPQEQAILGQPSIPYNLDAWDGYASARSLVLNVAETLNKNLVVLSGDTHNAWASNLTNDTGKSVGVEFATSSVTSPGFEEYLPDIEPATLQAVLPQIIPDLQYMNPNQRGYMVVTATPEACQCDWIFVSDILKETYSSATEKTLKVNAGDNKLTV